MRNFGVGYIILPHDLNRGDYIKKCLSEGTVTILTDNSEQFSNIRVVKHVLNDLEFPKDSKTLGSFVCWNYYYPHSPIVTGILPKDNEIINNLENQFILTKKTDFNTIDISGDAANALLNLLVSSEKDGLGKLNISVINKDETGEFNVDVQGFINFIAKQFLVQLIDQFNIKIFKADDTETKTEINYILEKGFSYVDEFLNKITIDKNGITVLMALDKNIMIRTANNELSLTDSGINIDSGENFVYINGAQNVLYSKIPDATAILDVSEIGVSQKVKVGG